MSAKRATGWKYYFPEDGETAEDAAELRVYDWIIVHDANHAASLVCEIDYSERDGWERLHLGTCKEFPICVISPQGQEHMFHGWHEPAVDHLVRDATP